MLKQSHLRSLKLSLIAAAVALLAAGCTFEPKYERPAAPVTQTFPEGGVYANQPDASSTASNGRTANNVAAPDIGWRDFFADARLQRIVELALKNNRDLRVSVLNVEAARAQYQITRAALFPAIDASASQNKTRTPKNLSFFNQTISNTYSVGVECVVGNRLLRAHPQPEGPGARAVPVARPNRARRRRFRWCRRWRTSICRCLPSTTCSPSRATR